MSGAIKMCAGELDTEKPKILPHFFSSNSRPIYALFCSPIADSVNPSVLVACHSFGPEHAVANRVLALGVRCAAIHGYPAMSYHARGHGDSGGDPSELTFESLVEDALAAADHARELSGASRVVWLGLRIGGLIAAEAASRCAATAAIALWEPIHRGSDYFRELVRGLMFSAVAQGMKPEGTVSSVLDRVEREGSAEILAWRLESKFYLSARDTDLSNSMAKWAGPTLLAQIQPRRSFSAQNASLIAALQGRGANVTSVRISEEPGWQFPMWRQPWTSSELLDETGAWLDALARNSD